MSSLCCAGLSSQAQQRMFWFPWIPDGNFPFPGLVLVTAFTVRICSDYPDTKRSSIAVWGKKGIARMGDQLLSHLFDAFSNAISSYLNGVVLKTRHRRLQVWSVSSVAFASMVSIVSSSKHRWVARPGQFQGDKRRGTAEPCAAWLLLNF